MPASAASSPLLRALRIAADNADTQDYPSATLYVVATPIGNRADITVRALACLARVDAVAAEDTRNTRQLLHGYGLDKPMIAAHHHNEQQAASLVVSRLAQGERIAYVSDAGTPGISDPGAVLVAAARAAGHRVVPVPGASALSAVLSVAGLGEGATRFIGFLPSKSAQAAKVLAAYADSAEHLVLYEAPHRIVETLALLAQAFGGARHCVIARELTKRFESVDRMPLSDAVAWITSDEHRQKGEFVVVIEAKAAGDDDRDQLERARPLLRKLCDALPVSQAASLAADITGLSRKSLYAEALRIRDAATD